LMGVDEPAGRKEPQLAAGMAGSAENAGCVSEGGGQLGWGIGATAHTAK